MDAIVSYHSEFEGTQYSHKDHPPSSVHKRNVKALGHLIKRYEICSVGSNGQCSPNGYFYSRSRSYWWGIAVAIAFLIALVVYIILRRRRRQLRTTVATMSSEAPPPSSSFAPAPAYGHEGMYGYPIAMEPVYSTSAAPGYYSKNPGAMYAPPSTPPPIRSSAPIPPVGAMGGGTSFNRTEQDDKVLPPEYTPPDNRNGNA
ncbi:hypothetical protein BGZ76_007916 [Entomortierella beljakovae]|nr:hypothetical protein BGZ76_007916 [Entomortierella beljakovae]